jgi:hypothetical protein
MQITNSAQGITRNHRAKSLWRPVVQLTLLVGDNYRSIAIRNEDTEYVPDICRSGDQPS